MKRIFEMFAVGTWERTDCGKMYWTGTKTTMFFKSLSGFTNMHTGIAPSMYFLDKKADQLLRIADYLDSQEDQLPN